MNPYKLREIYKYLTRAKKTQPDLPDVFSASKAPVPAKTQNVQETEAVNRFIRANPRKDMAGGGMLVQPGFGGTRQGYRSEKTQAVKRGGDRELLLRLVKEANQGFKFVKRKDLQVQAGYNKSTNITAKEIGLDTLETKIKKAFDFVMGDSDKLVIDAFDPMTQVKKLVGTNDAPARYLKDYAPYEETKRLIKVLAVPRSKSFLQKAEGLTLGDLEFRVNNNIKGDNLFAPPKQVTAETKIMEIVDRHIKQGGTKIKWTVKPEITKGGYPSFGEARFVYNGKEYGMGELINEARDDPNFKEFFKAQREYKTLNDKIVTNPKTGEKIRFGNLMKEVYGSFVVPYNIDHVKSIIDEPFTSLRVLPARINKAAGNIIQMDEKFITNPELKGKYTKQGKEAQLKKIGYNFNQPVEDLIQAELKLADDVLNKGRVLRKPNEIIESIRKGENYVPDFYSKTAKPGEGFGRQLNILEIVRKNKTQAITDAAIKTASVGGFDKKLKVLCGGKAFGGRVGLANGTDPFCPAARQDPEGFLKKLTADGDIGKFFRSAKAINIAKNVARLSLDAANPFTLLGGELFYVGLDSANNVGKGMDFNEALDRAFIFYDFDTFDSKILERAKNQGFDENQMNLLQSTLNINKLDNRRKGIEKQFELDESDISGLTSDLTMGSEKDYANVNKQIDDESKKYINSLDKMGFDLSKDESYNTGFNYLNNLFKQKTQSELLKSYENRKRKLDPEGGPIGDVLKPIFDTQSYTQPLKYALDIVNLFTKNVGFESDRAKEQRYLNEMDPRELYLYNKERGFTLDDIQAGTSPFLNKAMEDRSEGEAALGKGLFQNYAGGGIAKLAGVDSGPPPESGPNSQGLPGLLKRVRNY